MSKVVVNVLNPFDAEYLKVTSNIILSYAYDAVDKYPEPKKEDYESEEEYKKAFNEYLLFLVDYVSKIKHTVFSDILDTYNDSITIERRLEDAVKAGTSRANLDIASSNSDIRRAIIVAVICCLISPSMAPFFIGLNGVRIILDKSIIRKRTTVSEQQKTRLKQFSTLKEDIYQFQDSLRTDYHSRKGELEELKNMILSGKVNKDNKQTFMDRLRSLISPESYEMEKLDEDYYENRIFLLSLLGKDVLIDSPKQMVKK